MEQLEYIKENIDKLFQVGQKLNLTRSSLGDNNYYSTYVKDVADGFVFIDLPTKDGTPTAIRPEQVIELYVISKDGVWVGEATIYKVERSKKIVGAWVYLPEFMEKIQRREFLRLNIEFPVIVHSKDTDGNNVTIETESANISGGGIAVCSKKPLSRIHNKIEFIYKNISINTDLRFIHVQYDPVLKQYITGFKFIGLNYLTSDNIHKLVISSQIQMRRDGLL